MPAGWTITVSNPAYMGMHQAWNWECSHVDSTGTAWGQATQVRLLRNLQLGHHKVYLAWCSSRTVYVAGGLGFRAAALARVFRIARGSSKGVNRAPVLHGVRPLTAGTHAWRHAQQNGRSILPTKCFYPKAAAEAPTHGISQEYEAQSSPRDHGILWAIAAKIGMQKAWCGLLRRVCCSPSSDAIPALAQSWEVLQANANNQVGIGAIFRGKSPEDFIPRQITVNGQSCYIGQA